MTRNHFNVANVRRRTRLAIVALTVCGVLFIVVVRLQSAWLAEQRWREIRTQGVLRVGIDPGVQPFSFFGASGWQGFDADVARMIAAQLNVQVQPIPVGYDGFYDALTTRRVDIVMSALVADSARTTDVLYSRPYFDAGLRWIMPRGQLFNSASDLRNKDVVVAFGSEADRFARFFERRVPGLRREVVADDASVANQIRIGTSRVGILPNRVAIQQGCEALPQPESETRPPRTFRCALLNSVPYVVAADPQNGRLLAEINGVIERMQSEGALDQLASRWMR